jgi:hypothetical protein
MMGSITPLGQRARGSRFWPTATACVVSSAVAGLLVGAALGSAGLPLAHALSWPARITILAAATILGLAADLRIGGLRLPTVRRQVNEDWMLRYRGPIYGAGFGFQLGLGFVTIVTTSAIYATLLAEVLTGDVAIASLVGLTFGVVRALPILAVAGVREPRQLGHVQVALARWGTPARRAVLWGESALALGAAAVVLR